MYATIGRVRRVTLTEQHDRVRKSYSRRHGSVVVSYPVIFVVDQLFFIRVLYHLLHSLSLCSLDG